jgi:hypothetical protein
MNDWRSTLKADPTDWLLGTENPSVRYFTLIDILGKNENGSDVKEAKTVIMKTGVVPQILSKQKNEGHWENPTSFYTSKYKGTVWQLLILAELGADEKDERIKKACEFILSSSQDRESGGFSPWQSMKTGGGRYSGVIPCLTGNMIWSLIRFGYLPDPRVQRGITWIAKYQRFDDGVKETAKGRPYDKLMMCFGKHSCHMGVVKALKALAEIPADKRSPDVKRTIDKGTEYMLQHHVHKKSHNLSRVSKPGWLHFGFPLMYQTDVLEILGILTKLGCRDSRMQEAVDLVVSKQDENGKWKLENTFNGKFQVNIEEKDKPSKWITLNALRVLKRFYGWKKRVNTTSG